jgi:glycosyltransferase involved in cell wall biosynthesis
MQKQLKNLKNKKILYLYTGDHPVHRKFAESVGADIKAMSWEIPKGYDIYFSEGEYTRLVIMKLLGKLEKKSKIIILLSDPRLFYLNTKYKFNSKTKSIKKISMVKKMILKGMLGHADGIICGSKFQDELLAKFNNKIPRRVVYPFISKERVISLGKVQPRLDSKSILFIGNGPDYYYKGIDKLLNVFRKLKIKYPDIVLNIVGEWDAKDSWKIKGVNFCGKQKSLENYFERSAVYLHLGRGEAFGVTIVEAMAAGLPSFVSNLTGAKEIVSRADEEFILSFDEDKIMQKLENYFELSLSKRNNLSDTFRKEGLKMNEKDMVKFFKSQFLDLEKEVYSSGKK